jgi:hypothetical protein
MPDWRGMEEKQLTVTDLRDSQRREVIAELASHLEEIYGEQRARGLSELQAKDSALADVTNWSVLARRTEKNQRTKSIWIPGLISLTLASAALATVQVQVSRRALSGCDRGMQSCCIFRGS